MPLEPGSRLGRIRIDARIGSGGMGAVYRGFDEKLERAVAVKEIHAAERSPAARARFLREARALSKLDHPNICRIYDVLELADGDYLILELIEGETLRGRGQQLPGDEALRIALQVARVLVVAHARGIVHRDLKPDNIMLTAAGEVKVLDFGLARFAAEAAVAAPLEAEAVTVTETADTDPEQTLVIGQETTEGTSHSSHTVHGSIIGTVRYMSPEQARGLQLDGASDVYALGVVLFELLTGHAAYGEPESLAGLLALVQSGNIAWRDLGRRDLNHLLHGLLARDPKDRLSDEEAVGALERALKRNARIRRRWLSAAAAAIALSIAAASVIGMRTVEESRAVLAENRGHRVAVLPFRNETGDPALRWVEAGLSELVSGGLTNVRRASVVPVEDTLRTMRGLQLQPSAPLSEPQRRRLLQALDADALIESVVVADERGRYTIRFAAAARDRVEGVREVSSSVLTEAAQQMVGQLALRLDPSAPPAALRSSYSGDPFVNMAYAIGQQEGLARGPKAAAPYFAVAADRDPGFAPAKLELAAAKNRLGEVSEADRLASEVVQDARRRGDRSTLAAALIRLSRFRTDRSDFANAESDATEALQIATALGDPRLIMSARNALGAKAWRTNQLPRAEEMFRAALSTAVAQRDLHSQGNALNHLALAVETQGRNDEAERLLEQALKIADRVNDRELATRVLGNFTSIYVESGRSAKAEPLVRRQIVIARELGDSVSEILGLFNLAILLYSRGVEEEALTLMTQAGEVAARTNRPRFAALAHSNLATAHTKRGELAKARREDAAAQALLPAVGADVESMADINLAHAYWLTRMGRLEEAERVIDRTEREWKVSARGLRMRARVAYERGNYRAAGEIVERALALPGEQWLGPDKMMSDAFLDSRRTGKPSVIRFEEPAVRSNP